MSERELTGRAAPPMVNGELDFAAPWQGRVFGMANVLCERGLFEWSEFQAQLIGAVGEYDAGHAAADESAGTDYPYYELFTSALVTLLTEKQVFTPSELAVLEQTLAARPHGHDHSHGDHSHHDHGNNH